MINLLIWVVVGGLSGWIASMIMKTNDQMGCLTNVIVGMVGSLVGGAVMGLLTTGRLDFLDTTYTGLNVASLLVSIVGAVIFIWILRLIRKS